MLLMSGDSTHSHLETKNPNTFQDHFISLCK